MPPLLYLSYNCRGWNSGSLTLQNIVSSCDVCFIQEHWLHTDGSKLNLISYQLQFVVWIVVPLIMIMLFVLTPSLHLFLMYIVSNLALIYKIIIPLAL